MKVRLVIPRLQVTRDWYKGLLPDHTDHSHPDVAASKEEKKNLAAVGRIWHVQFTFRVLVCMSSSYSVMHHSPASLRNSSSTVERHVSSMLCKPSSKLARSETVLRDHLRQRQGLTFC